MSITCCVNRSDTPRPQDGSWAWFLLIFAFLNALLFGGLAFGFGVILPVLMTSLNENRERTALVGSLALGLSMFLCSLASKCCEQFTCRGACGCGLVISGAAFAISSFCKSVNILYLTYSVLFGAGFALSFTAYSIAIRQYFNKRYSLAMGISSAGAGVGTLIAGPTIQALTYSFGWPNTFRIISGVFVFFLCFLFVLDPNVEESSRTQSTTNNNDKNEVPVENGLSTENVAVTIPRKIVLGFLDLSVWMFSEYVIMIVAIFVVSFGHYTALIHMVKFADELSISNSSTLLIFFGSATVVSRLVSGRLCDISSIKPRHVHQVGAILSGVSTILLTFAKTYSHLVLFAVFYGIADGAVRVTVQILFMNTVDLPRRPSAFGQANMLTSIPVCAGPAIAGLIADKTNSYKVPFYMAGGVTVLGGLILFAHLFFIEQYCSRYPKHPVSTLVERVSCTVEMMNKDNVGVVDAADHPMSCIGPAIQDKEETQITTF